MLSKRIKYHRIYILKMPRDCNQTRSADRWGNSQLKNLNFLVPNTYFSSLYWCEFSLTKYRKYWEDRRIIQKYFENKTTNIYPRFRSQWVASRRVSFQFLLHFLDEPQVVLPPSKYYLSQLTDLLFSCDPLSIILSSEGSILPSLSRFTHAISFPVPILYAFHTFRPSLRYW